MKAILEFDLPEDNTEHDMAVNAHKMHSVIFELRERLRSTVKHNDSLTKKELEVYEKIREELNDNLISNGLIQMF